MSTSSLLEHADPIRLEVAKHLFSAIAEEMGVVLRRASYSPNIKERRDYSCALFDSQGQMIAQAAHIPVHLGSMPLSVEAAIQKFLHSPEGLSPGDMVLLNDPYLGGTHLPDITLVTPIYLPGQAEVPFGYVASRAHHADVGGMTPGSMPIAREIFQEGLIIPPVKLLSRDVLNQAVFDLILANVRTPVERAGDIWAQIAANKRGASRLIEIAGQYGAHRISQDMQALLDYTEHVTRRLLETLPDGTYEFTDFLDDNGIEQVPITIHASIKISSDKALIDFTGSAPQQIGSVNAVYAITLSAVYYVFRSLIGLDIPNNSGCMRPIEVIAPPGTVVNALHPAPVAGGNVETSQRIVDVLLGALAQAAPGSIPAASQGTMNNLTIGGWNLFSNQPFAYYETIGGGIGASQGLPGASALHSHMTNTLNTPVEALEYAYPLRIIRYAIRQGSGGEGQFPGGDGIIRDVQVLVDAQVTLLTERRKSKPYGLAGGMPALEGVNILVHNNEETPLPSKGTFHLKAGDILSIRTPGGGGWGILAK